MGKRLDMGSAAVIIITFLFFMISLFLKGLGHEILLDIGVFLVSVKLILMSFRNNLQIKELNQHLDEIKRLIKNRQD